MGQVLQSIVADCVGQTFSSVKPQVTKYSHENILGITDTALTSATSATHKMAANLR